MRIELTRAEVDAVLWATGNFTHANAYDIDEMVSNGLSRSQAKALLRAEDKMRLVGNYKPIRKTGEA